MEKISVIIPTWNRAGTIVKAIKSVLNQTLPVSEILVCDDGSTDGSKELVKLIKDKRVKWLEGKHSGLPAVVRNRGIKFAKGIWLAFLDSDDEWLPNKLEEQVKIVSKFNARAVCSNANRVILKLNGATNLFHQKILSSQISFSHLIKSNPIICSSILIKKDIIQESGHFPEDPKLVAFEDYALWLRVATKTKFYYIASPLLNYNDSPKTTVRKAYKNADFPTKFVLENYLSWLINRRNKIDNFLLYYIPALIKLLKWRIKYRV